jgi:FkbH-like protein
MQRPPLLAVSATFTAEPLEEALRFWIRLLELPHEVEFAPYNQVFQQLLDPGSLLATNTRGINLVLVRFEDWVGGNRPEGAVDDLVEALRTSATRLGAPHLVFVCPRSPGAQDGGVSETSDLLEMQLIAGLAHAPGVYVMSGAELAATYPLDHQADPLADQLAHVPFTRLFFAGLGSLVARKVHALVTAPPKVIVLDCDHTLWQGVCGEDGPTGIELDPGRRDLHTFMVAQHEDGMLLCLASKNNEEDVLEVFHQRPDLPLRLDHFTAWRLNWQPKSANFRSLAAELGLGLDSFVFIDDNPLECEEVRLHCPEVTTLQLPADAAAIPTFLRHVWAFDRLRVTDEDRRRGALYRQNARRERLRQSSTSLAAFLETLGVETHFSRVSGRRLSRAAQLTQRTNQFNVTTIRRSEAELQTLLRSGQLEGLAVDVSDRFGDYGMVGLVLYAVTTEAVVIDTFLLSCRAMGRGVEHRMLAEIGRIANERGRRHVVALYRPTSKNVPAATFLKDVGTRAVRSGAPDTTFEWAADVAAATTYVPDHDAPPIPGDDEEHSPSVATSPARWRLLEHIATELTDAAQILKAIRASQHRPRPALEQPFVAPRTPFEEILAAIWRELFDIEPIGVHDNFFELGGHSLLATLVISRVHDTLGVSLPATALFETPTIEGLALAIAEQKMAGDDALIHEWLDELDPSRATSGVEAERERA